MTGSIYMAANGALAYQTRLEILSNNLANVNTAGFKQDKSQFQQYYLNELTGPDLTASGDATTSQAPAFWFNLTTHTDHSSGPLKNTGNRFDLAIAGDGFFCVQTPQGIQYTRRGDFAINAQGLMVTREGWSVLGENGEITIESKLDISDPQYQEFMVGDEGSVSVDGKTVGRLRIVEFPNTDVLEKVGDTYFRPNGVNPGEIDAQDFMISQGMLELSNVDAVKMMTELIEVHRGYESYLKIIRAVDEVNSSAVNEVGKA